MSQEQVNTNNLNPDDYSNYLPHKHSVSSRENSKYGPSLNPDLFLPKGAAVPTHLQKYVPKNPEPTNDELLCAKLAAQECDGIKDQFNNKWLGVDYADPTAPYNCSCIDPADDEWETVTKTGTTPFLTAAPASTIVADYTPPSYSEACGSCFTYYTEYSKTNATFWNTPAKTPLYRRAQTSLLGYWRIRILVHGDLKIKPGKIITIDYPIGENTNIKQSRYSGKWMVYKVKHVMTGVKHSMYLYLMRDGAAVIPTNTDVLFDKNGSTLDLTP